MTQPTVGAGVAQALIEFAVGQGAGRPALIARSGITAEQLEEHANRIPLEQYMALVRASKDLCQDPALALHFAERVSLAKISIVGLLAQASKNLREAFEQMNRYSRLVIDVETEELGDRFRYVRNAEGLWLVDTRLKPDEYWEHTEATFARAVCSTRAFGDKTRFVRAVHVTYPDPGYRGEYDRIFRAPVVFGSHWNALLIEAAWLDFTIQMQPRYVFGILSEHAAALLERLVSSSSMRSRVERDLMTILHTGNIRMSGVAARLGLSRATLFRRLKAEGVTFERVLDDLRHRLAVHYLGGRKASVNETAYLVGFSDPAAFSRAFKRWTGITPSAVKPA